MTSELLKMASESRALAERPPFMVSHQARRDAGYAESEDSQGDLRLRLRGTFIDTCEGDEAEVASPRAHSDPGSEISSGYSAHFAKERVYVAGLSQKVSTTISKQKHRLSKTSARSGNSADSWREEELSEGAPSSLRGTRYNNSGHNSFATCNSGTSFDQDATPTIRLGPVARGPIGAGFSYHSGSKDVQHRFGGIGVPPSSHSSDKSGNKNTQTRFRGIGVPPSSHSSGRSVAEIIRPISQNRDGTYNAEPSQNINMNQAELRHLVHKKTAEINDVLNYQRLSTALTSINEIPEQVGEVLQQSATNLLDDVQEEVAFARDWLVNNEWNQPWVADADEQRMSAEKAQESLTTIPDMIMASFENSFAKAMSTVRIRVDDVIHGLEGSGMAKEQMVKQMWAIPEEVRQITRDAVKEASQQSREKVVEQFDCVLQSFSPDSRPDELWQAKRQIVARVPKKLPELLSAATEAAETNVCQAVKFVEAKCDVTGVVANRVVADTLLRAKVGKPLKTPEGEKHWGPGWVEGPALKGLETLCVTNPGSVGHPELCSRACLYFPLGKCSNGVNCQFCHAPHSKRATHLDKRHREMLRAMDFHDRFLLLHPILKSRFLALEVGPDVMETLQSLYAIAVATVDPERRIVLESQKWLGPDNKKRAKESRTLQIALKFMSVRSLLTLLHHAPMTENSELYVLVETLMQSIRPESSPTLPDQPEQDVQSVKSFGRSRTSYPSRPPSEQGSDVREEPGESSLPPRDDSKD